MKAIRFVDGDYRKRAVVRVIKLKTERQPLENYEQVETRKKQMFFNLALIASVIILTGLIAFFSIKGA